MNAVRWLSLELSGFGVYDEVKVEFPNGLGVLVAANESGKSTAVAGLTAVVFGLPTNNDPTSWGTARYRSYSSNARFAGRVQLVARDGKQYEVRRDFESHDVNLSRIESGSHTTLFTGKHNPGARKGTGKYEDLLEDMVGIGSAELFRQTFSIEQPLQSESGLSEEVAGLLAGSGGGSHRAALDYLTAQIEQRTRYTADHELPGRNKNKDRELEEVEARIRAIEEEIVSGRAAADGLQKVQLDLLALQAELEASQREEEKIGARERSARDWLEAQHAHGKAQRQLSELQGRFEKAHAENGRLDGLRRPSVEESRVLERDWSFAEGTATAYLRSRRHDAEDALEEYRLFGKANSAAADARKSLERFRPLEGASPELLDELRSHERIEKRLENDVEGARKYLEEFERHLLANDPNRGFEDVAGMSDEEVGRLRSDAARPRAAGLLGGLVGSGVGVAAGLLLGVGLPILIAAALVGVGLGVVAVVAWGRRRRHEARQRLVRFGQWQLRAETTETLDLTPHEERVAAAEKELASFRDRVRPFRQQFPDLAAAFERFDALRGELADAEAAAARYARDQWGVTPAGVDAADALAAGGCWERIHAFLEGIGQGCRTVHQVVMILEAFEWDEMEADATAWDAVFRAKAQREQELDRAEAVVRSLLEADGVESLDEFREKLTSKQTDALAERNAFKEICELNPELPRFDDPGERRSEVADLQRRYASDLQELASQMKELKGRIFELTTIKSEKQGQNPVNIAALEIELEALREERDELKFEVEAYALAYVTLDEASREYQDEYLERLSELVTDYFRDFSGRRRRYVEFGDGFRARVVEGGEMLDPGRLSQGAQDQLVLASRLAIADMIGGDAHLPLVFDDPFLNCDAERLVRIREALKLVAEERQVLLLSHEDRFGSWGEQVRITRSQGVEVQDSLSLVAGED